MPGTTRYSATFDRPYEEEDEEDLPAVPPLTRRSRSASWQATTANGRPYTPLGGGRHARSSSTDNGPQTSSTSTSPAHSTERIPTRTTGKVSVKTSHNPFQFVKVGTCPLYKNAEELLKKTQKVKQPEALKEEEEEWQTNLDSWKSRRRKMSQDVFRRQEEMKELLEMEEQPPVDKQKKVKTFSEMVKEGASRGRTLSLCLFSNPLELDDWANKDGNKDDSEMSCNDTHQSSGSAESSNVNSEDDNDVFQNTQMTERNGLKNVNNTQRTRRTGAVHFLGSHNGVNNGISHSAEDGSNCDFKVSDLGLNGETLSHKCDPCQSGAYNDSGLDSLSSSHRAGDIPDSGSDFSQDSGSSLDCDSPGITGIPTSGTELLEEFSSKDMHPPPRGKISHKEKVDGMELCLKLTLTDGKSQQYGFTINGGKDKGLPVTVASVINGSASDLVGLKTGDHILAINKEDISSLSHSAVISSLKQSAESRQLELLLWRPASSNVKQEKPTLNGSTTAVAISESPSKRQVTEQTSGKETCNKTNSKATKVSNVTESSVDNRVEIVDSQSSNRKAAPVKQKDLNCKVPATTKSQAQESSGSTSEATKSGSEVTSIAENQHSRSVESENEMFVDDFNSAPISNNSKIPVAEKSPKIMGKRISKSSQEIKKNKSHTNDSGKTDDSLRKAKENVVEDSKDSSLNIIYQSQSSVPKAESNAKELLSADPEHPVSPSVDKKVASGSSKSPAQAPTNKQEPKFNEKLTFEASEILPVDKVAEQMERLILEQLEEEERLKEKPAPSQGSVVTTTTNVLPEHELSGIDTPPRQVEPPKEKPPPPPTSSSSTNKDSPLNRVNSTKRIKKEMQKRRSDFLGIEKSEEEESVIPPPPDLENIIKLECEQERKVREMLGTESLHQRESSFEEEEIARKEREIIENLETEERMRMAKQTVKDQSMSSSSSDASFAEVEVERIRKLQEERVRMEEERFLKEEQRIRLEEERQLREREEQIRREEGSAKDVSATASSVTVLATNFENTASVCSVSASVSNEISLSQIGDGKNKETVCMPSASGDQSSIAKESTNNLVPTKPLKKKEVIRKERERLRQEQEALQREREEYRRQMMKEQELLKESQKPHAPDAPVSRVGAPPPLKPALPLPLTSLPHASQVLKENVIYTSRSPPTNSVSAAMGNHNTVVTSQNPPLLSPSHNTAARPKITQNDAWGSHKVPVKKQPDASSESRYNQNHWLIQEAEMRRISEQKERQRVHPSGDPRCAPTPFSQGQYHPMHIAEENYCGAITSVLQKPPAIPGVPSLLNKPPNYPVPTQMHSPEQQWNYGQPIHPTPQNRKFPIPNVLSPGTDKIQQPTAFSRNVRVDPSMQAPTKPSRVIPMDRQEQMLSVSGRKRCSHCGEELGRGAAMIIESLQLYYHIQCFRCCVCQAQLGNGSCGTDVRVRNNKLHCHNCYSNDEAGLKFSQV